MTGRHLHGGRLVVDVVGVRVEVTSPVADAESLREVLAGIALPEPATADVTAVGLDAADSDVESVLGAAALAAFELSPDLLVHAGAVARDGQAVLFPGVSGAGKSTMTAACLRRGFGYLTDEMVAVDLGSGQVKGWPRPLMLTSWSVAAVGLDARPGPAKEAVDPHRLGASVVAGPVAVGHVIAMRRGAAQSRLHPVGADELLGELLASSFNHYRFGVSAWEAAVRLVQSASCWRLDVADLDSAADAVAALPRTAMAGREQSAIDG